MRAASDRRVSLRNISQNYTLASSPGTALGAADKKNGNVAEWYLTNFRVRFAREDGSWFDPDIEDFGGTPCPGCTADEKAP